MAFGLLEALSEPTGKEGIARRGLASLERSGSNRAVLTAQQRGGPDQPPGATSGLAGLESGRFHAPPKVGRIVKQLTDPRVHAGVVSRVGRSQTCGGGRPRRPGTSASQTP